MICFFLSVYKLHYFNYFNYFNTINTFMTVRLIKQNYLRSLAVVLNDTDVKSHYDLSNSQRQ